MVIYTDQREFATESATTNLFSAKNSENEQTNGMIIDCPDKSINHEIRSKQRR